MGLIKRSDKKQEKIKHFYLTPFGRIVFLEDPYLKESVTQWVAHLNLCDPIKGADVWYQVFIKGYYDLGLKFSREKLEEFLKLIYGHKRKSLIGPLIRMYQDDASFGTCQALQETNGNITRNTAPIDEEFSFAYGAWLLESMNNHFPESYHISLSELDEKAGWSTISNWNFSDIKHVLNIVERKGAIEIDRHMDPWLLKPRLDNSKAWQMIFDDRM
jgi:hypothetical protein